MKHLINGRAKTIAAVLMIILALLASCDAPKNYYAPPKASSATTSAF